jgi:hypothetical protein
MSVPKPTKQIEEQETVEVVGTPQASILKPKVPETLKTEKKDPEEFKKWFDSVGKINIKPFIDGSKENMGLEKYGMAIFPGTYHEEQMAAMERNGVVRYITGLDEFAPEVQQIADEEEKQAVIYNIRSIVVYLEKMIATNILDINDKEFWNKVKRLRPDNIAYWSTITIRCGNEPVFLDPAKDPVDLIKYMSIEAGGFDLIAKSYDDALARPVAPKFYLDKEVYTVSTKISAKRVRNKALALLDEVSNKNPKKLLYITKVLDTNSASYKNSTSIDILYDSMDNYIAGNGVERNPVKAAENFMNTSKMDMESLKLKALVKDASFFKVISLKADGMLYHTQSSVMLGRNVSDVVLYLKNPLNEDVLIKLLGEVEIYWNK